MTVEAYKKRVEELKKKNIRCAHFDFRGQQPIEYLKVEVFEEDITRESYHWDDKWTKNDEGKWVKSVEIVDWTKNFILLIAELCGVETDLPTSKKEDGSFISSTTARRLTPAGNKISEPGLYDFDAAARVDVKYWDDIIKFKDDLDKRKYPTEAHKNKAIAQLKVNGAGKADTGAEKRAIIKLLKIPTPLEKNIGVKMFCFRCVPDMTNSEVRQGFLNSQNPANAVFGTQKIEHKPDDIIQPAEQSGSVDTTDMDIEMCIDLTRQELKENPAIYKLAGIILDKKIELEKFRTYIDSYAGLPGEKKISTLVEWISKIDEVNEEVTNGDETVKKYFLQAWGK